MIGNKENLSFDDIEILTAYRSYVEEI